MTQTPKDFVFSCLEEKKDGIIIRTSPFDTKDHSLQKILIKTFQKDLAQKIKKTCIHDNQILYEKWTENQNQRFLHILHELEFRWPEITPFSLHVVCIFAQDHKTLSFIQNKNKQNIRNFQQTNLQKS